MDMLDLVLLLIGICSGIVIGIGVVFWLMGQKFRDQFLGRNLENKPVVIDWIDGHTKDFNIMMRGVLVFTGTIRQIMLQHDQNGQSAHIELMDKAEVMREFRY